MSFSKNPSTIKQNKGSAPHQGFYKIEQLLEEVLNKNNFLYKKHEYNKKNSDNTNYTIKDIEHLSNITNDTEEILNNIKNLLSSYDSSNNNIINSTDNLKINVNTKDLSSSKKIDSFVKVYNTEKEHFIVNKKRLNELKLQYDNQNNHHLFLESSNNDTTFNSTQIMDDSLKVNIKDIKFVEDISKQRNEKLKYINEQVYYVDKLSSDAFLLTKSADAKVQNLLNNVDNTLVAQKEAQDIVIKTSKIQDKQKNKKCILLIIIMFITMSLVLFMYYN